MPRISIILPTNRKNSIELTKPFKDAYENATPDTFDDMFYDVVKATCAETTHYLYPTIASLDYQTFNDFELILLHKQPSKIDNIKRDYVRIVKEKPSMWHCLGSYPTVNNIRNTGIMNAQGELLFFLDDMTIFPPTLLERIWKNHTGGGNTTCRAIRRIRYNYHPDVEIQTQSRITRIENNFYGVENFKGLSVGNPISLGATWTYGCSVSFAECIAVNGFDEIYDGNFGGTDEDFGLRLMANGTRKRVLGPTIYEFTHKSIKYQLRDDAMLRQICKQLPLPMHIKANSWKPTSNQLKRYERYHKEKFGSINPHWNKFMDVPLYDMQKVIHE